MPAKSTLAALKSAILGASSQAADDSAYVSPPLRVTSKVPNRWRAGRQFGPTPQTFPQDAFSQVQVLQLKGDRELIVDDLSDLGATAAPSAETLKQQLVTLQATDSASYATLLADLGLQPVAAGAKTDEANRDAGGSSSGASPPGAGAKTTTPPASGAKTNSGAGGAA